MPTKRREPFCEVCGAVEAILLRELVTPDSGNALMCEQCWADYCEQTGARREQPGRSAQGRQRRGIISEEAEALAKQRANANALADGLGIPFPSEY